MSGRWQLRPRDEARVGRPWLVLRGDTREGVLWNGPVLELGRRGVARLGPDVLAEPLAVDAIAANLRTDPSRALGDALLDQHPVAGIGNLWKAEGLWRARLSPWPPVRDAPPDELAALVVDTAALMRASVAGARPDRRVYRKAGRPCPR